MPISHIVELSKPVGQFDKHQIHNADTMGEQLRTRKHPDTVEVTGNPSVTTYQAASLLGRRNPNSESSIVSKIPSLLQSPKICRT